MRKFAFVVFACAAVTLGGCETTKQVEVVATEAEKAPPPMPAACRSDGLEKFKQVPKAKGKDATEVAALGHTLQSNKSRMTRNEGRSIECECALAKESKNPDDLKRLEGKCPTEPTATAGQPVGPTKGAPPTSAKAAPKAS